MIAGVAVSFLWRCALLGTSIAIALNASSAITAAIGWVGVGVLAVLLVQYVWGYLRGRLPS